RPSINALFRSAAVTYGKRVVGLILSGALEDGTTGLWWIQRYGGIAVVQDPAGAPFGEMPHTALDHLHVDFVLRVNDIAPLLIQLAKGSRPTAGPAALTGT